MNMIRATAIAVLAVMLVACSGGGATTAPTTGPTASTAATASTSPTDEPTTEPSASPSEEPSASPSEEPSASPSEAPTGTPIAVPVCDNLPEGSEGDLLATICERGNIIMSTDPAYPPQSELTPEGTYEGFDISVGQEIADRLGVELTYETPAWEVLTAGSWSGRWDFSVGSMTITTPRQEVLDFTQPYYFTPAQLSARADSGITDFEGFAGKVICVGEGTTYLDWLEGDLDLGTETPEVTPPEGTTATTLPTDRDCAEAWRAGREEFDGWLTSSTTTADAVADGLPVVLVGEPIFNEPLAAAFDKSDADHDQLVEAVDAIIGEMHADGTLSALSTEWFGLDLTLAASE